MAKKLIELKKNLVVTGFILLILTLASPTMPWVSVGYSVDGIIQKSEIERIKYSESLAINFDLFGRGVGEYTIVTGDNVESTMFYAYIPDLKTYGIINLIGSLITSIGLGVLIVYGFTNLPLIVFIAGAMLVLIGGGINLGVSLAIQGSFMDMTMIFHGEKIKISDYFQDVLIRIQNVPPTILGTHNFCGMGIGNFINMIGGAGNLALGLYFFVTSLLIYLKPPKEEEVVGVIPE